MMLNFMLTCKFTLGMAFCCIALMVYAAAYWEPIAAGIFGMFAGVFWGFAMLIAEKQDRERNGKQP